MQKFAKRMKKHCSHQFAVPILVLWMGLEKSKEPNLDVRNIFAGSHTEHGWRC
jgi:hypothetical protein